MHAVTTLIVKLVEGLPDLDGDKPATYARAKELRALADALIKVTQPGAGEFKYSAKAIKELVKPASVKQGKPIIIIARGDGDVWHTTGHYAKRGEVSKRFGDLDVIDMPIEQFQRVIPNDPGDVVTVIGAHEDPTAPDCDDLLLSNGTIVNRTLLTYTMDGFPNVVLRNASPVHPISVVSDGVTVGLVMPIRPRMK